MKSDEYDVAVVGAGHNGLTCAAYLARAGLREIVCERRAVVGGACVTEEFHPGFRNSTCAYTVSLLNPKVLRELELERHGLRILRRTGHMLIPAPDDRHICLHSDQAKGCESIARHSPRDAEAFVEFEAAIDACADVLRALVLEAPPNVGGGWGDLFQAGRQAWRLRGLDRRLQGELARLFTSSVGHYLQRWFELDLLQGALGYVGQVGNFADPWSPGSAYVLLHHMFGEVNGAKGAWGHAVGGMGAITEAMARAAAGHGAEIRVGAPVREVLTDRGRVRGLRLDDGGEVRARAVAANCDPRRLFLQLVDATALPPGFLQDMRRWRCGSGTFRMNVALGELPRFRALEGTGLSAADLKSIQISPSLAYLGRAYDDARRSGWSREPVIEMLIPSLIDDSLAPPGKHVMSLFCQHFNPELPEGQSWDAVRERIADHVIDAVTAYAPNFRDAVIARLALSPLDLEREYGLTGGDIFHGALHLDQIYSLRPAPGYAAYRMPVKGLYLCGSGAHPGGGVSGCPGHNAARAVLEDLGTRGARMSP